MYCRHAAAMDLLHHGVDRSVIALWLGHESAETTKMYLHADMRLKEKALLRTAPLGIKPGRYHPNDELWFSWKASDYADSRSNPSPSATPSPAAVGIIGESA